MSKGKCQCGRRLQKTEENETHIVYYHAPETSQWDGMPTLDLTWCSVKKAERPQPEVPAHKLSSGGSSGLTRKYGSDDPE